MPLRPADYPPFSGQERFAKISKIFYYYATIVIVVRIYFQIQLETSFTGFIDHDRSADSKPLMIGLKNILYAQKDFLPNFKESEI